MIQSICVGRKLTVRGDDRPEMKLPSLKILRVLRFIQVGSTVSLYGRHLEERKQTFQKNSWKCTCTPTCFSSSCILLLPLQSDCTSPELPRPLSSFERTAMIKTLTIFHFSCFPSWQQRFPLRYHLSPEIKAVQRHNMKDQIICSIDY